MKLENAFEVAAPAEDAWALLQDVPRVVPCMPGAELVETVGDTAWKARMRVKLGPIQLSFLVDVTRELMDESSRTIRLATSAREERGRGAAQATIESRLAAANGGTKVDTVTDLTLTGPLAQYARGMVQGVAAQILDEFARCLERELTSESKEGGEADDSPPRPAAAAGSKPVSGVSLGLRALWHAVTGFLRRG